MQQSNPAYQRFPYHLSVTGRYPAAYIDIFWNKDAECKIKDVEVVFIPRGANNVPHREDDLQFWKEYGLYNKTWQCDLGNSCASWLEEGGMTPASIFGVLLASGFSNDGELKLALEEFAHIEECNWAREMLQGFCDK